VVEWARLGPKTAQVVAVNVFPGEGEFDAFEQWPTA
jgi:hypothetical protein